MFVDGQDWMFGQVVEYLLVFVFVDYFEVDYVVECVEVWVVYCVVFCMYVFVIGLYYVVEQVVGVFGWFDYVELQDCWFFWLVYVVEYVQQNLVDCIVVLFD